MCSVNYNKYLVCPFGPFFSIIWMRHFQAIVNLSYTSFATQDLTQIYKMLMNSLLYFFWHSKRHKISPNRVGQKKGFETQ